VTLLIHPGLHKTATSWLQTNVFSETRLFRSLLGHAEVNDLLVAPHDFDFDAHAVRKTLDRLMAGSHPGIVDVISSEILSGNIILGSRDCVTLAWRVAATCPDAKVLLTVRAQGHIAKSIYLQYLRRGGYLDIEQYLSFKPEPGYSWFDPGTLQFDRIARTYAAHFGQENVLVLPQELLSRDRMRYLRLLCEFVGVAESEAERDLSKEPARGISPPASGGAILRRANVLRQSALNPRPPSKLTAIGDMLERVSYRWTLGRERAEKRINQVIKKELSGRFGESNKRLQEFVPVDLAALGYEMAG